MASLRDISAECQLSINAVSEILNHGNEAGYRNETCERVWYPGLPSHSAHAIAIKQMADLIADLDQALNKI